MGNKLASVVVVLILLVVVWKGWSSVRGKGGAEGEAIDESVTTTTRPIDNEVLFGWDYKDDYPSHNFVCTTCCCDRSRRDFVYVSYGKIEFDIKAIMNRTNILTITVGNLNENCRRDNVFIDGKLIGTLDKDTNGALKNDFQFEFTPLWKDQVKVRIEHLANETLCWWGNDVYRARVDLE